MNDNNEKPHIVVVGGGIVGTTSAYFLARTGRYRVTLLEEADDVARETSFANAGRFCPSIIPNYAPSLGALKSLLPSPPSLFGGGGSRAAAEGPGSVAWSVDVVKWGTEYIRAATTRQSEVIQSMKDLARCSKATTEHLVRRLERRYPDAPFVKSVTRGNVWIYHSREAFEAGLKTSALARANGFRTEEIADGEVCRKRLFHEAVSPAVVAGGCIISHDDFTADAREFTRSVLQLAKDECGAANFQVKFGVKVTGVTLVAKEDGRDGYLVEMRETSGDAKTTTTSTPSGTPSSQTTPTVTMKCDKIVLATGPKTNRLAARTGLLRSPLPIVPIRGCSLDLRVKDRNDLPLQIGFSSSAFGGIHFQATPLGGEGKSLRVVGFADVVSDSLVDTACPPSYKEALLKHTGEAIPGLKIASVGALWTGYRPFTPDRLPVVGAVTTANKKGARPSSLFLNVGHGSLGWTIGPASALLLTKEVLESDGFPLPEMVAGESDSLAQLMRDVRFDDVKRRLGWGRFYL